MGPGPNNISVLRILEAGPTIASYLKSLKLYTAGLIEARKLCNFCSKLIFIYIVTCRVVRATKMTGSSSDDCI
jgi:hypothetical protein